MKRVFLYVKGIEPVRWMIFAALLFLLVVAIVAVLLSGKYKDTVVIKVGSVSIYKKEYEDLVAQAAKRGIDKDVLTDALIEYYRSKEAARMTDFPVYKEVVAREEGRLLRNVPDMPRRFAMMAAYGNAVRYTTSLASIDGVDGRIVFVPFEDVTGYGATRTKEEAEDVINRAKKALESGNTQEFNKIRDKYGYIGIDAEYVIAKDGTRYDRSGSSGHKVIPVAPGNLADYMKNCQSGVCDVAEDGITKAKFFVQVYNTLHKIDDKKIEDFMTGKQKVKVVKYE